MTSGISVRRKKAEKGGGHSPNKERERLRRSGDMQKYRSCMRVLCGGFRLLRQRFCAKRETKKQLMAKGEPNY
jgi:hypothetical protein